MLSKGADGKLAERERGGGTEIWIESQRQREEKESLERWRSG